VAATYPIVCATGRGPGRGPSSPSADRSWCRSSGPSSFQPSC